MKTYNTTITQEGCIRFMDDMRDGQACGLGWDDECLAYFDSILMMVENFFNRLEEDG